MVKLASLTWNRPFPTHFGLAHWLNLRLLSQPSLKVVLTIFVFHNIICPKLSSIAKITKHNSLSSSKIVSFKQSCKVHRRSWLNEQLDRARLKFFGLTCLGSQFSQFCRALFQANIKVLKSPLLLTPILRIKREKRNGGSCLFCVYQRMLLPFCYIPYFTVSRMLRSFWDIYYRDFMKM